MKKYLLPSIVFVLTLSLVACDKDNDGIQLQAHDDNRLMDTMHAMMDRMMAMPKTDDPDVDFTRMMIMHHTGAVNMANVQLTAGSNDSLKRIAQKIITEQETEIEELTSILSGLTADNTDSEFTMELDASMMKGQKTADVQIITGDIDNDFATLMIVHHQGAVDNASSYLHHGGNNQLKTMATNMVNSQTGEISELANWLIANKR